MEQSQLYGRCEIYVSNPSTTALQKLGEGQDSVQISEQHYWNDVPGDRHGGSAGPPIEVQHMGMIATIQMELSRHDTALLGSLRTHNLTVSPEGFTNLDRVGMFQLRHRSSRLVLINRHIDAGTNQLITSGINYPCCLIRAPISYNRSTKYTAVSLTFEAHRAPDGHPYEGVVYNYDTANYTAP